MRLIDAHELMDDISRMYVPHDAYHTYDAIKYRIEYAPTIEAEPVRHGRWMLKAEKGGCLYYHVRANCSECGWDYYSKEGVGNPEFVFSSFCLEKEAAAILFVLENAKKQKLFCSCPNCGAKMDGKAIDAITEAFNSDECESFQINLIQTEQSGHVSKLSIPPDMID